MKCLMKRKMTVAEQEAADREIKRQLGGYIRKFEKNIDAVCLYVLHVEFGWGVKRLRKFYDVFQPALRALSEYYEMNVEDQCWLCEQKLKQIGVDLDEWRREEPIFKGRFEGYR